MDHRCSKHAWEALVPDNVECEPGSPAPRAGRYQQLNVFGTPVGTTIRVAAGEPLPAAPRGLTWRWVRETRPGMPVDAP
jgi:hypothetical protein